MVTVSSGVGIWAFDGHVAPQLETVNAEGRQFQTPESNAFLCSALN